MNSGAGKIVAVFMACFMLIPFNVFSITAYGAAEDKGFNDNDYEAADSVLKQVGAIADTFEDAEGRQYEAGSREAYIFEYLENCNDVDKATIRINGNDHISWSMESGISCSYSPRVKKYADDSSPYESTDYIRNEASLQAALAENQGQRHGSDIYLFEPYYGLSSDFTDHYQKVAKKIAEQSGGAYHYYKGDDATVDNIADALEKGGIIIFNSHGTTDYSESNDYTSGATTSYLCLQTGEGLTADDYRDGHATYSGISDGLKYYQVDGTVLANHMDRNGSNGFIWMAICLGMATDGLAKPLLAKGEGAVYGYSQRVTFKGDCCFSDVFFANLIQGRNVRNSISAMKEECGEWDYSPKLCAKAGLPSFYMASTKEAAQKSKSAFPVVVSAEDIYPGNGNVDDTQAVNSTWALKDNFSISAVSADETRGKVSVEGFRIITIPEEGYAAGNCTVMPEGAAEVTREGNNFRLSNLIEDCVVTVSFERREQCNVNFITPDGVHVEAVKGYMGDEILLPSATEILRSSDAEYNFSGWSRNAVEAPVRDAEICKPGEAYKIEEKENNLYAVYSYQGDDTAAPCKFKRVEKDETDRNGSYVMFSDGQLLMWDGEGSGGEAAFRIVGAAETGAFCSEKVISRLSRKYTLRMSRVTNTDSYVIRFDGASRPMYMACASDTEAVTAVSSFSDKAARWNISFENGNFTLKNVKFPEKKLKFCGEGADAHLCCTEKDNGRSPVLYKSDKAYIWYTGSLIPQNKMQINRKLTYSDGSEGNYIIDGKELHLALTFINSENVNKNISIYMAEYDDSGRMLSLSERKNVKLQPGQSRKTELDNIFFDKNAETAGFLFLEHDNFKPLCEAVTLSRP